MSKPRTVTRTITVTQTIGQIAYEASGPAEGRATWDSLDDARRAKWERIAEAVADVDADGHIPEDVASEIDAIAGLWVGLLPRADEVARLCTWLKDVRKIFATVLKHEADLHQALGLKWGVSREDAIHEARKLRSAYLKCGEKLPVGR